MFETQSFLLDFRVRQHGENNGVRNRCHKSRGVIPHDRFLTPVFSLLFHFNADVDLELTGYQFRESLSDFAGCDFARRHTMKMGEFGLLPEQQQRIPSLHSETPRAIALRVEAKRDGGLVRHGVVRAFHQTFDVLSPTDQMPEQGVCLRGRVFVFSNRQ